MGDDMDRKPADDAGRSRDTADTRAEDRRVIAQIREANEQLVLATVRADESAEAEAEGRRRAEVLAEQLLASQEALRASELQFRTLANSIPMLAWYASPDGSIAWANDRCYEYTGKTFEEIARWEWGSLVDSADLPRVAAGWRAAVTSGAPWEAVFRLRRHDGVMRWFLARAFPLRDEAGRIVRWFGTTADIDDQKRAEERALASDRAKDEFLAMLGHELRNPLSPIVATLDLMEMRDPTVFARERALIQRQVDHLAHLVDDLLDVSRIAEGKIELHCQPIELAAIVSPAVEMVRPLVAKKEHRLIVNVADRGLPVDADPTRLAQAVGNLLTNAVKYTPARGVVEVTAEERGSIVSLRVRDTGIGISAEMLPHVFELFAQERQALDRSQGGLGLGLTIVHRLVEMHRGTVTAASEGRGHGSTFTIELPRSSRRIDREAAPGRIGATTETRGLRVLVVDDNRPAAETRGDVLRALGHEVAVALDGPSALAIARDFAPEVALLDIGLPGMDGYEVAKRLRAQSPHEVRFIAITGYGQAADLRRSQEAGFESHLVKPVGAGTLEEALRQTSTPRSERV